MSTSRKQSTSDQILLASLAAGASHADAARAAGVSERTVRRRAATPEFDAQLTQARDEHVAQFTHRLTGLLPTAVATLTELMAPDISPGIRLRAASNTIAITRTWRDATEIENRLRSLEDQASTDQPGELS